ncbi:cytochrome P450 [Rickenella mellea]|uniref:Cytochrome P450 n=1 Tax=Rickenella mellea TaxID=50990 RepID=A0A4Y7PPG4_9AGAM|nr:cytochrome P450 [Rickenella mellea]
MVTLQTLFPEALSKFSLHSVILVFSLFVAYKVFRQLILWPYFLSPLRSAPGPPLGNPIFGQFPSILRSKPGVVHSKWAKEHGPTVRVVGPFGMEKMMYMNPEALHKILVSDWVEYPRPEFMRRVLGVTAGWGLLTTTGDEHRQMRKAMNPAFSIANLTAQTDMYYEPIYGLLDILRQEIQSSTDPSTGKVFHIYEWLSKATLDIICLTAFGYKTDSLHNPDNELADAYHKLIELQSMPNLVLFISLITVPGFLRLMKTEWMYEHRSWLTLIRGLSPAATLIESMHRINNVASQILSEKTSEASAVMSGDTASKRDIMSLLVQARKREVGEGYRLSDADMIEQVLTFLGAGHETTASGLAWTLWLLAEHPSVQTKLRAEVTSLISSNAKPDFRALKQMEYLDAVIMESLRVLPPVPMTLRKAGKSDFVDGVFVPKGTLLYIAISVVNKFKGFWGDDAEDFRPERWFDLPKCYNQHFSLLTFIAGPHHCIGRTMAITEMKAVVAILIANLHFEPAFDGQIIQPTAAVTMKPDDNLPLRVRLVENI